MPFLALKKFFHIFLCKNFPLFRMSLNLLLCQNRRNLNKKINGSEMHPHKRYIKITFSHFYEKLFLFFLTRFYLYRIYSFTFLHTEIDMKMRTLIQMFFKYEKQTHFTSYSYLLSSMNSDYITNCTNFGEILFK